LVLGGETRAPHRFGLDQEFAEDPNTGVLLDLLYRKFLPQFKNPELVVDFPKVSCKLRPGGTHRADIVVLVWGQPARHALFRHVETGT
jgi:hypothetical protein